MSLSEIPILFYLLCEYHCEVLKHKVECEDNISSAKDRLLNAAKTGDVALIRSLLDGEVVGIKTTKDGSTLTPLCISAQRGHLAAVLYLLRKEDDTELAEVSQQALQVAKNDEIRRTILEEPNRRTNERAEEAAKVSASSVPASIPAVFVDKKKCPRCQSGGLCRTCPSSAAKIKFKTITKTKRKIVALNPSILLNEATTIKPSDSVTDAKMSGVEEEEEEDEEGEEDEAGEDDEEEENVDQEGNDPHAWQTITTKPKNDRSIMTENQPRIRATGKLVPTALSSKGSSSATSRSASVGKSRTSGSEGSKKDAIDAGKTKEMVDDDYDDDAEEEKLECRACGYLNPVPFLHPICGVCESPLDVDQPSSPSPGRKVEAREEVPAHSLSSDRAAAAAGRSSGKGKALFRSTHTPHPNGWSEWAFPPTDQKASATPAAPPKTWKTLPSPAPQSNPSAPSQTSQSNSLDLPKTWKSLVEPQKEPAVQGERAFPPLAPSQTIDGHHPLPVEYFEMCDKLNDLTAQSNHAPPSPSSPYPPLYHIISFYNTTFSTCYYCPQLNHSRREGC